MQAFGALPIYRQRDVGKPGGPPGGATDANEATFAGCRALLRAGRPIALFPEGTTHSNTMMLPLRTGAARIALSAEAEASWQLNLQIVPVGLWYQKKSQFRCAALRARAANARHQGSVGSGAERGPTRADRRAVRLADRWMRAGAGRLRAELSSLPAGCAAHASAAWRLRGDDEHRQADHRLGTGRTDMAGRSNRLRRGVRADLGDRAAGI